MKEYHYHTHINAAPGRVFAIISDASRFSEAVPDIVSVEILSDQKTGLGTRFRETRLMNGRKASTELEVTGFEDGHMIRFVANSGGTVWDSVFTVEPEDGGSHLNLTMTADPKSFFSRLMLPLIGGMIKKALEKDMEAVKAYCEGTA